VALLIRRFLVTGLMLFALPVPGAASAAEQRTATGEDNIKATFLFNFTKFVDWPAPGGAPPSSEPFRLCVVAEPAFVAIVDRTIEGESVGGRPLQRVSPASPAAAGSCQILFLGRLENDRVERWISAVRDAPVLVVSESAAAWDRGTHINFFVEENRVRFDVNADAASRTGISISSKLLRVARRVTGRGGA
jgi:uncharacterized protein DUF4154